MSSEVLSDNELVAKLKAYPELKNRLWSLLSAIDNETGQLKEADAAELRIIDEMRAMGQVSLGAWAKQQMESESKAIQAGSNATKDGKKNCVGTPLSETSP